MDENTPPTRPSKKLLNDPYWQTLSIHNRGEFLTMAVDEKRKPFKLSELIDKTNAENPPFG